MGMAAEAKVWRVNNNAAAAPHFTEISLAVADAAVQNGDTLYVEGSAAIYNNATLTKKLVLIGPGYFLSGTGANTDLQATPLTAEVNLLLDSLSSGSTLVGLSGIVRLVPSVDNIGITRCKIFVNNQGSYMAGQRVSNLVISKSFLTRYDLSNFVTENLQIINCVISGAINMKTNATLALLRNNTLNNSTVEADNTYIANNIFFNNSNLWPTNSVIRYNIASNGILPVGAGNQNWQTNTVMNTGSDDGRFRLSSTSVAFGAGEPVGGITPDCGAFGTADPYRLSGIPPIPTIYALEVPASIPGNATTMSVKLSTRSNN